MSVNVYVPKLLLRIFIPKKENLIVYRKQLKQLYESIKKQRKFSEMSPLHAGVPKPGGKGDISPQ